MTENSRKVSSESAHSDTATFRTTTTNDDDSSSSKRAEHFKYCRFIRQVCQRVEVHPKVTVTALLVYHKIYHFEEMATFDELDPYTVATSCIWIAAKGCEELTLRMRDVVNVVYQMLNPGSKPLALDDDYYDLRDTVTTVELLLLRILEFKIPEADFFGYLVKFLYSLEKWCHGRQSESNQHIVTLFQAVSRTAISIMLDGLHQPIYLTHDAPSVALACLDMAAKAHNLEIPLDQFGERSWRKALYRQAEWPVIKHIQSEIMRVYEHDEVAYNKSSN